MYNTFFKKFSFILFICQLSFCIQFKLTSISAATINYKEFSPTEVKNQTSFQTFVKANNFNFTGDGEKDEKSNSLIQSRLIGAFNEEGYLIGIAEYVCYPRIYEWIGKRSQTLITSFAKDKSVADELRDECIKLYNEDIQKTSTDLRLAVHLRIDEHGTSLDRILEESVREKAVKRENSQYFLCNGFNYNHQELLKIFENLKTGQEVKDPLNNKTNNLRIEKVDNENDFEKGFEVFKQLQTEKVNKEEFLNRFCEAKAQKAIYALYAYDENDEVVGMIIGGIFHSLLRGTVIDPDVIVVKEKMREKGVGRELMHAFAKKIKSKKWSVTGESGRQRAEAHKFYEGFGFKPNADIYFLKS